jgi:hypothetical protein
MAGFSPPAKRARLGIITGLVISLPIATHAASTALNGASPGEISAIESVCGAEHSVAFHDMCVANQIRDILRYGRKPDLSVASEAQRQSIEHACAGAIYPGERFACERLQLSAAKLPVRDEPGGGPLHAENAPSPSPSVPSTLPRAMPPRGDAGPRLETPPAVPPEMINPPARPDLAAPKSAARTPGVDLWRAQRPAMPPALTGAAPSRTGLYDRISPSVYVVRASDELGENPKEKISFTQGGAVAVSNKILLTNCHILSGRTTIRISQDGKSGRASLVFVDPVGDRCFLASEEMEVNPVQGVRRFDELHVGETIYSLGAPVGLEWSLGEGLVSGLHEIAGVHIVQNSAPTWHGSSGGGLFDVRGNLVGITTAVATNVTNLSFSIAADDFWF